MLRAALRPCGACNWDAAFLFFVPVKNVFACVFLLAVANCSAQETPIKLWPNGAPGALGNEDKDTPTLTPFLPHKEKASGAAIVVCPGGGYGGLAAHEGPDYAIWLNQQGIAAFVLKYRLGTHGDAQ